VTSVEGAGSRRQPTGLILSFDEPLDPQSARETTNYFVFALGRRRRVLRANDHPIAIRAADYSAGGTSVVLALAGRRLSRHGVYELVVAGTAPGGVSGLDGQFLDGRGDGHPGSNYVTVFNPATLVFPGSRPGGRRRSPNHGSYAV
jgi:hypothetical protein